MLRRGLTALSILAVVAFAAAGPQVRAQQGTLVIEAQGQSSPETGHEQRRPSAPAPAATSELPADAVTSHSVTAGGRELGYVATAGTLALANESGEHTADIVYTAYLLDGTDHASRPITFVFNGGPGAASAYLHIGALGPRILDYGSGRELPSKH